MNGERLLEKMSDVKESLIIEAEKKPKKKRLFIGFGLAAAAAVLAITAVVNFIQFPPYEEPPVLDMSDFDFYALSGMGYEGISAAHPSELENGNPWSEKMKIRTMPVFASSSIRPDSGKMTEMLMKTAEYFGLDIDSLAIHNFVPSDEEIENLKKQFKEYGASDEEINTIVNNSYSLGYVETDQNGISISVDSAFTVDVRFDGGIALPDGYNLDRSASEEELSRAGDYLINEYGKLLNMKNPVKNLNGEYSGSVEFYDGGSGNEEAVTNYSLNLVRFISNDAGKLWIIRIFSDSGCEKIADYPIISAEEAQNILFGGNYLTSVPYDITGDEEIGKVELMYRSDKGYEYVMPFYRFLVKLPEEFEHENRDQYGGYYVPAVRSEYLIGMPDPEIKYNGSSIRLPK